MRKKSLGTSALKSVGLVDDRGNVLAFPPREDDSIEMDRDPTGMELRCAKVLYETHTGLSFASLILPPPGQPNDTRAYPDIVAFWIYVKTARAMIQEMRTLSFDVVQNIRGKPFHDAKDIWETIIDECSP